MTTQQGSPQKFGSQMTQQSNPSLPRAGHVSQLRNNWRVFEDEALAFRMQHEEISDHYAGNRVRNQQIRSDLPQAKQIQNQETEAATREREQYRLELNSQALADERMALEVALRQRGFLDDDEYSRRKDQMIARNIEDIERKYRQRNQVEDGGPSIKYNDQEYKVQMAKPAVVTDEPLYANYQEERFINEMPSQSGLQHSSRTSHGFQSTPFSVTTSSGIMENSPQANLPKDFSQTGRESNSFALHRKPVVSQPMGQLEISSASGVSHSREASVYGRTATSNDAFGGSPALLLPNHSRQSSSSADQTSSPRDRTGVIHGRTDSQTTISGRVSAEPPQGFSQPVAGGGGSSLQGPSMSLAGLPPALPAKNRQLINPNAGQKWDSSSKGSLREQQPDMPADPSGGAGVGLRFSSATSSRVPPLSEDLNTSSDYLTSRTSSRTSHRSDSSLTSYSEQGAVGYLTGYGPAYGACGVSKPGQKLDDRWKYDSRSSNDFDPMDSLTPRQRDDSTGRRRERGEEMRGAVSLPVDELSLRSALSPEEIRAAEAAEHLLEQERKDAELAMRLQNEMDISGPGGDDRKLAQEAQDREFARVLQAKEKARLRRAKEKARQKKLEKQRLQEAVEDPDSIQYLPEDEDEETNLQLSPREQQSSRQDTAAAESQHRFSPETRTESRTDSKIADTRHDRTQSRISQVSTRDPGVSPRDQGVSPRDSGLSPVQEPDPPARRPYVHTQAIDSHMNDTYCKTQITPTVSNSSESSAAASSETSEPQYENLDKQGKPLKTEPILHLPSSKKSDKISPRQSALNEDMPVPPYMPMQSSATRKSESLERKIKKKKEKEGCKQQ